MMSLMGRSTLVSKRRSRLVRMPTSRPSLLPSSCDGHAGDPVLRHQLERLVDPVVGGERDRVDDHAALRTLHAVDLRGLFLDGEVLVDDAEAALLRHRDGEPRLGDGVHRCAEQRHVEPDARREAGGHVGLVGQDPRVPRDEQDVVEGEGGRQARLDLAEDGGHGRRFHVGSAGKRPALGRGLRKRRGPTSTAGPREVTRDQLSTDLTPHDTSCTSCRSRKGRGRCGRPWARRAGRS